MKQPPETPLHCHMNVLPNGYVSFCATQKMTMPDDAPHVRGVAIYIPKLLETPTVSVQIVTNEGGARMMVTSLKINLDVSGYTQIAVAAQVIPPGTDAAGVHHCNIVAIGKPEVSGVSGPCF